LTRRHLGVSQDRLGHQEPKDHLDRKDRKAQRVQQAQPVPKVRQVRRVHAANRGHPENTPLGRQASKGRKVPWDPKDQKVHMALGPKGQPGRRVRAVNQGPKVQRVPRDQWAP
jgi:hypothetical protein